MTVGHHVMLHGCVIEDGCLIGMGATILDGAVIGRGSLVAAGTLVTPGTVVPPGSMVVGSPGKVRRQVSEAEAQWLQASADNYVDYAKQYRADASV